MISSSDENFNSLINVADFEQHSRNTLSNSAFAYLETGAGDGYTARRNTYYWNSFNLTPRILEGIDSVDTTTKILGKSFKHPIFLAPVASHTTFHPEGEQASIKGALESNSVFTYSTHASISLQEIPIPTELNWWFQIYLHRQRAISESLIELALSKGAGALVLTVDTPVAGYRDLDRRTYPDSGLRLTPGQPESTYPNLAELVRFEDGLPRHRKVFDPVLDPKVSWKDVEELISKFDAPIILKGILSPDDAKRAFECGAKAIVVSNHGGRNLDGAITAAEAIYEIRSNIGSEKEILVDGGIRRGSDVFRALALGANAIMIGRPYIWGLSTFGSKGVARVVDILLTELEITMLLCGARTLSNISKHHIHKLSL